MDRILDKLFQFIKEVLPGLLASFGLGYKAGAKDSQKLKENITDLELKLKHKENEDAIEKEFEGLSDSDVIDTAVGVRPRKMSDH